MKWIFLFIGILLALSGCAKVTVEKVNGNYSEGLRFYRPAPYLLVSKTKEGMSTSIVWLPDKNEEYVLKHEGGFGNAELKAKLEGGWNLTDIGLSSDSKVPETITALGELATGLKALAAPGAPDGITPGLYKIIYKDGSVSGIKRIDLTPK